MPVIKAKKGDETVEYEFDEIVEAPEGIYTEDQVNENYVSKDYFESEVSRRLKNSTKNAREELANDEEFIRKQIRKRGGEFDDEGNLKSPKDVNVDKLTEDIRSEILQDEVEPLRQENKSLKSSQLSSEVLRSAPKVGATKHALRPVRGGKSLLEIMAEDNFAYHSEKGMWAQVDSEGNFLGGANGLRGIDDWLKDLKGDPDYEDLFQDETQSSSNYQGRKTRKESENSDREKNKARVRSIRGKK